MNLERLKRVFADNGCQKIFVKRLKENDNSKNQVYLGGIDAFNVFSVTDIKEDSTGSRKRECFKAAVNFSWIGDDGSLCLAPGAQFILYPDYPEVRFSGFLQRCEKAPSSLMAIRLEGRLLFLSITDKGRMLGFVTGPDSLLASEFHNVQTESQGVFRVIELTAGDDRSKLLYELNRIHRLDWIESKRLDKTGLILPCNAPNCGGYTLEAELGITPNGYSEPDFLGWEVKQFGVASFARTGSAVITLMTPEPTDGLYVSQGIDYFIRHYGYPDKKGRPDRLNFGGIHKSGIRQASTGLTIKLIGFDIASGKIKSSSGRIALMDDNDNEAAAWSFASMLSHWSRKHNQACYVPSQSTDDQVRRYRYGNLVILGIETDFQFFLQQMAVGSIYYDPGIKMENVSTKPIVKRRSQFRIKSQYLGELYRKNEVIDILKL